MTYEIRLDEFGAERSSSSTVLIAQDGERSIHWGNASHRGETRPIVTIKIGFLAVTVDESVIGKKKLSALRDHFYAFKAGDKPRAANTTLENRIEAAHAAIAADDFNLACDIEPSVLFDMVVLDGVKALAGRMTVEHIGGIMHEAAREAACIHRRGIEDAKAELREWLGT